MKIILINPRIRAWSPNVWVPLGLSYVAAALEQEGYNVEIIDLNVERMNDRALQKKVKNANIVGITGMITEYREVLKLVNTVKLCNGDSKVVLGGALATTLPQELLQVSQTDFMVIGEGERTTVNLISAIERGDSFSDVKGIAYKDGDHIIITEPAEPINNLDTIPFPARHLLHLDQYIKNHFKSFGIEIEEFGKIRSTNLITSRGCPYSCTFCFRDMWGYKWRGRSAANIVAEIELLKEKYNVNGFFFNDDTFVLDRKRVFEFCELLKKERLDIVWYCNGRVNLMQQELLKAMHDAGCRGIAYGIESGNQQILNSMKKNITLEQVRKVSKWTKETGIFVAGYFMIGMLGETRNTIRETITLAKELELDFYAFSIVTPFPGTELYNIAVEKGLVQRMDLMSFKEWDFYVNVNLTQDCTDDDLVRFKNEVFKDFTLKKFGKYYIFNSTFLGGIAKVILSLRSRNEAKELAKKIRGVIQSYWQEVQK